MKLNLVLLIFLASRFAVAQRAEKVEFNKEYADVKVDRQKDLTYSLAFEKNGVYKFSVMQKGVDVVLILTDNLNKKVLEQDTPNGQYGLETFEYTSQVKGNFSLTIKRLEEAGNPEEGKVSVYAKHFSRQELERREKIKLELASENEKNVLTVDVDHFWEAFDNLKKCKTHSDSVSIIQTIYLDRATNGLIDFTKARDFTAEEFVNQISLFPKFFASVRKNTYEVKKAAPMIEEVFAKFKEIYPNFKPFKVCFAIGLINTGGTTSNQFVLIGTEVSASTKEVNLSEFNNNAFSKVLASEGDVAQKLRNIVAHECVHTQQITPYDNNSVFCRLLYRVMIEGFSDFIGEMIVGGQINSVALVYGDKHEKELWKEFKNELCNESQKNWLYNYFTSKERPADLGYYIGYKIAKEYYRNALDKKQAIIDIIEMNNPLKFLELSRYDQKVKE
jgi:Predicted Zn-dependent protease (DUF2268)